MNFIAQFIMILLIPLTEMLWEIFIAFCSFLIVKNFFVLVKSGSRNILPELLDEFPFLHLTPATLSCLYRRATQQVDQLSRAESDAQRRKTKAQEQAGSIYRRRAFFIESTNEIKRYQIIRNMFMILISMHCCSFHSAFF